MSRTTRHNTELHFYSPRLLEKLRTLLKVKTALVEAPAGFGKSTAVWDRLNDARQKGSRVIPLLCHEEPAADIWRRFCAAIGEISPQTASALSSFGVPDQDTAGAAAAPLAELDCGEETCLLLDDFQKWEPRLPRAIWKELLRHESEKLHLIVVSWPLEGYREELNGRWERLCIDGGDLRLSAGEILLYFKAAGFTLAPGEEEEAERLTGGWIMPLRLQMLHYRERGRFLQEADTEALFRRMIWERLDAREQDCLLRLSPFDRFTLPQARDILGIDGLPDWAVKLLDRHIFISRAAAEQSYEPHSLLLDFVRARRETLTQERRREILEHAAAWSAAHGDLLRAFELYQRLGEYEKILALDLISVELGELPAPKRDQLLHDVVARLTGELIRRYPMAVLNLAFELFAAGDIPAHCALCARMEAEFSQIPEAEGRDRLLGEIELLRSFQHYNDIEAMSASHRRALELIGGPASLVRLDAMWSMENPSVLFMFHREAGALDRELGSMKKCFPHYLALTNGHGSGADTVMGGEVFLMRGELAAASDAAGRALGQAALKKQTSVKLAALCLKGRIAILEGDAKQLRNILDELGALTKHGAQRSERVEAGLARSLLMGLLGRPAEMEPWLKNGEIEGGRVMIPAVPFAQTVYGSWLLQTGGSPAMAEFLARGLAMASALNCLTAAIYLRLYEAVELLRAQRLGHAAAALKETLALALPDRLCLPFAEWYEEIEPILEKCCTPSEAATIRELAERQAAGRKNILCGQRFTLSEAELIVAKCAARGMHNAEIAEELNLSPNTIKKHLKSIFKKLGIEDRRNIPAL